MFGNLKKFALVAVMLSIAPMSAALAEDTTYATQHAGEPAIAADQGRIYIYRKSSLMGAAVQPDIYVNGEKVWTAKNGDYTFIDRPAGSYEINTSTDSKDTAVTLPVVAGQPAYVRIGIDFGLFAGHGQPAIVLAPTATDEIKDLDYRTPDSK
ncbi:MAG TPA: DUF2846 domain-containing protein [Rhizomicrobium sp.]|jgi:hypothetical protein